MVDAAAAGITPDMFWDMTPAEVAIVLEGQIEKQSSLYEMLAHFFAPLMNMWRDPKKGSAITPRKLFNRPGAPKVYEDPQEYRDMRRKKREEDLEL